MTTPWVEVGERLRTARLVRIKSARAAARQAGMSATYWQDFERGFKLDGGRFNPSSALLEAAARTVGLDPAPLFELAGRSYTPSGVSDDDPALAALLEAMDERLSRLEAKVDAILDRVGP